MIRVEELSVRLGRKRILDSLSFEAGAGKVTLLFGPNGAGKTTTLRAISGLLKLGGGSIRVGESKVECTSRKRKKQVSYLPQGVRFQPRLSVRALLRFYGRLRDVPKQKQEELLEEWGLSDAARQSSVTLSGGMRQRLGLVVLLLPNAPVLLLDEPGLSLDPVWRERMKNTIRQQARDGKTVLLATHLVDEWTDHADVALYCEEGKIKREVAPGEAASIAKKSSGNHC